MKKLVTLLMVLCVGLFVFGCGGSDDADSGDTGVQTHDADAAVHDAGDADDEGAAKAADEGSAEAADEGSAKAADEGSAKAADEKADAKPADEGAKEKKAE